MMRIGLFAPSQRQQPFAEFNSAANEWRVWIAFNPDVTSGTYLALSTTGSVERVTVRDGVVMEIVAYGNTKKIPPYNPAQGTTTPT